MKNNKGITLIALIITIVVMIILVSIAVTTAIKSGLFGYASKAIRKTEQEAMRENIQSILPGYYIEKNVNKQEKTVIDFLKENIEEDIVAYTYDYNGDYNNVEANNLVFNCQGQSGIYGFKIDLQSLKLTSLGSIEGENSERAVKVFELVQEVDDLKAGEKYIIASAPTTVNAQGTTYTDVAYVLDEYEEGGNQQGDPVYNRKNKIFNVEGDIITYNGDYALTLEGDVDDWEFYDAKNDGYLSVTEEADNYLALGEAGDYSKTTITFNNATKAAEISFNARNDRNIIRNNNWITSCYSSGQEPVYLYKEVGSGEVVERELEAPVVKTKAINREATFTWTMMSGASYYLIWEGEEEGTPITSPYTKTGLINGKEYTYQIKAVKNNVEKLSIEDTVTPIAMNTYRLVSQNSDLEDGESYIIVNSKVAGTAYTLGEPGNNNVGAQSVDIIKNGSYFEISYAKTEHDYILEWDAANSAWKIYDELNDTYLCTPFDSNTLRTIVADEMDGADKGDGITDINLFNLSFGDDGNVIFGGFCDTLVARRIQYNSGSKIFSFYSTNQGNVYLYKCID